MYDNIKILIIIRIRTYSGRIVLELKNELIREKVLSNYRIIYQIKDDMMEVVCVLYHASKFTGID